MEGFSKRDSIEVFIKLVMKRLFTFLIVCFFSLGLGAQSKLIIVDSETGDPIEGVFARLVNLESGISFSLLFDENGESILEREITSKWSKAIIHLRAVGYESKTDTLKFDNAIIISLNADYSGLNAVIVSDQLADSKRNNSIYKINVISRDRIEKLAAQNLRDILQQELNMRISQDQVLGPALSYKGLSGENIKFLIDGVPIIGRLNGSVDLSQINVNDIERIEIVDGPMSAQYGSNAIAATVNIIMKKSLNEKWNVGARLYSENNGTFNSEVNLRRRIAKNGYIGITGMRNFFNGWSSDDEVFDDWRANVADSSRFQNWNPREQYVGRVLLGVEKKHYSVNGRFEVFDDFILRRGNPRGADGVQAFDDTYQTFRKDYAASAEWRIAPLTKIHFTGGVNTYERRKNTIIKNLTNLSETLSRTPGSQDTTTFTNYLSRVTSSSGFFDNRIRLLAGGEWNRESSSGLRLASSEAMTDVSVFTEIELQLSNRLKLRPTMRYGYNSLFGMPVLPAFNLLYKKENHMFRASWSRGFRAPSLKELFFYFVDVNHNIVGNLGLRPELGDTYQANWEAIFFIKNSSLRTDLSLFFNDIRNLITLAQVSDVQFSYVNIGLFRSQGASLSLFYSGKNLSGNAGYAVTGRTNNLLNGEMMPFRYTTEANASITYRFNKRFNLNSFYKYTGKTPGFNINEDGEIVESFIDDFHTLDLNLGVQLYKDKVSASVGIKNALNVTDIRSGLGSGGAHSSGSMSMPVAMGRIYFVQINYSWKR
jgi:outer membrane receptor for ferrienterochelin and colicins